MKKFLVILQSCKTMKELNAEFDKKFGWLRIIDKYKANKLKKKLIDYIDSLVDDEWNIEYLKDMENILIAYYNDLHDYMDDISILDHDKITLNSFKPIYFSLAENNEVFILEIVGTLIKFTIYNYSTGESLEIVSENTTSQSQKKVEIICKNKIIKLLKMYLDSITTKEDSNEKVLIERVKKIYDIDEHFKDEIVPPLERSITDTINIQNL